MVEGGKGVGVYNAYKLDFNNTKLYMEDFLQFS